MVAVVSSQYRWPVDTPHTQTNTITREGVSETVQAWGEWSTGEDGVSVPTYNGALKDEDMKCALCRIWQ
jgi:hypothetical protein